MEIQYFSIEDLSKATQTPGLITIKDCPERIATSSLLGFALNLAVVKRIPVELVGLDMNDEEIVRRLLKKHLCYDDSEEAGASPAPRFNYDNLYDQIKCLESSPILIQDATNDTFEQIKFCVEHTVEESRCRIFIFLGVHKLGEEEIIQELISLAKELSIVIVALTHAD